MDSSNQRLSFLIITRQDQRTSRKVNVHFIAEEFVKRGNTKMFSFAFSWLSRIKKDHRVELWNQSNKPVNYEGVDCYLWRSIVHPVNLRKAFLLPLEKLLFAVYLLFAPSILKQWIKESSFIMFESGFPNLLIRMCKRLNPNATLVYLASDSLAAIDCSTTAINEFFASASLIDYAVLPSKVLKAEIPPQIPCYFVPHGLDKSIMQHTDPCPYDGGVNIISVGSMLFDPTFFEIAADAFPDITFHVIGGGADADLLNAPNIKKYGEMPFLEIIPYIKHANAGVAPYNGKKVSPFLADTSMKLMQYSFLGIPAICPQIAVGTYAGRLGYIPEDKQSIIMAIKNALRSGNFENLPTLSWEEVASRIIDPKPYSDILI